MEYHFAKWLIGLGFEEGTLDYVLYRLTNQ